VWILGSRYVGEAMSRLYRCDWPECTATTALWNGKWSTHFTTPRWNVFVMLIPIMGIIGLEDRTFCPAHAEQAAKVFGERK